MATIINGGKSTYLADALVKHALGQTSFTMPTATWIALTSDVPTSAGGTELVVGTSPGYARVQATMIRTAVGVSKNNAILTFPTPTGIWLQAKGFLIYDASSAGNVLYFGELLASPQVIESVNAGTDFVTITAHGLVNNQVIRFRTDGNGALPAGLASGTPYYIVNKTANTFQVSLSQGGSVVDITDAGTDTLRIFLDYYQTANTTSVIQFAANTLVITEQ